MASAGNSPPPTGPPTGDGPPGGPPVNGTGPPNGPPNGPPPSPYQDTSSLEASIFAAWIIFTVFASLTVGLRFYVRKVIIRVLGVDDWLILGGLITAIGTCIGFIRQTLYGLIIPNLAPAQRGQWAMEQWYSFLFYGTTLHLTKLSILFLYRRFLPRGGMRITNWIIMAIVVLAMIWAILSSLLQCIPLEAAWNRTIQGKCIDQDLRINSNTIIHVITDFMIFLLPLPVLWKLHIHWKEKVALIGVFSLGFFVCIISIIRLVMVKKDPGNIANDFANRALWAAAEVNLAIVCACLTTLKPLVARLFPGLVSSLRDPKTDGSSAPGSIPFSRIREPSSRVARDPADSLEEETLYPLPKKDTYYTSSRDY